VNNSIGSEISQRSEISLDTGTQGAGARGHYPQLFHKGRNGGGGVFYKSIIGSFMVYPDRFEINLLQLFAHPKIQNGILKFMVLFLKPASLLTRNKHNW